MKKNVCHKSQTHSEKAKKLRPAKLSNIITDPV